MNARNLNQRRTAQHLSSNQRGSAVVLVVVSLVLMALLGAVYLQTTRVQSFTANEQQSNIDSVIAAIIVQIQQTLHDDLKDDPTNPDVAERHYLELYDYPWTNVASGPFTPEGFDGPTTDPAYGGLHDDMWLASLTPKFPVVATDPDAHWPKITNLNGLFLGYDRASGQFEIDNNTDRPEEYEVDFRNWPSMDDAYSDTNLLLNSSTFMQLVDASGDGMADSRWTWAPLHEIRGVQYVMAVRIVDLSGKVNINTALSLGDDSSGTYIYDTTPAGTDAPFFHTPSEIDLGKFVHDLSGGTDMGELGASLAHRLGSSTMPATLINRDNFWLNQGRYLVTNTPYGMYGRDNTYELLRREGLNQNPGNGGRTLAIEEHMPSFLRRDAATETIWSDVANDQNWYELEPRKQMTGESGAAVFAWPRTGTFDGTSIKQDINDLLENDPDRLVTEIGNVFAGAATLPGGFATADVNKFATQFVASMADYADLDSNQLTEVEDPDNPGTFYYGFEALPFITEVYSQAKYRIAGTLPPEVTNPGPPAVTTYSATWEQVGNVGYAIEIRNPFRKPISLEDVELVTVTDEAGIETEASWGMLWEIDPNTGVGSGLAGQAMLDPDEVLILYRDSNSGTDADNDTVANAPAIDMVHDDNDLFTSSPMNKVVRVLTQDWPEITVAAGAGGEFASETFEIHLRARITERDAADPDRMITYSKANGQRAPTEYIQTVNDGGDPAANPDLPTKFSVGNEGYWQQAWAGNGEGLNILAVYHDSFDRYETVPDSESGQTDPLRPREDKVTFAGTLGMVVKGGTAATGPFDALQLRAQQIVLSDRGEFFHVGEVAHVMAMGPIRDLTTPANDRTVREILAEAWSSGGAWRTDASVEDFMLNFDPSAAGNLIEGGGTNFSVPHAALLIDRLTTLSPRADGVDNDNDGTPDNDNENIIPGLININTAPRTLLEKVIPVADEALREEIARRIVEYREAYDPGNPSLAPAEVRAGLSYTPSNSSADYRNNPGIAHAGELFFILGDLLQTNWTLDGGSDYSGDVATFANGTPGTRFDFLSNPAANGQDHIVNDREEMALLAGWLSQVGTVRSDYFAAYVLVRGYTADKFNDADGLVEGARFIAIFRRNAVGTDGEIQVQMLAPLHGKPYMVD